MAYPRCIFFNFASLEFQARSDPEKRRRRFNNAQGRLTIIANGGNAIRWQRFFAASHHQETIFLKPLKCCSTSISRVHNVMDFGEKRHGCEIFIGNLLSRRP